MNTGFFAFSCLLAIKLIALQNIIRYPMQTFFVLVEPQYPENLGSVARAMKTMGFEHLILVNPCDYKSDPASWLAVGSEDILNNASVFEYFDEAVYDMDFIIGTSSKKRQVKFDYYEAEKIPVMIREKGNSIHSVALVFGREDYGWEVK